jgi:putative peptidoglycan lipid II flippase
MTTIVPELASAFRSNDTDVYRERFSLGIRLMSLVILPAATGYVVLAQPIVHALLKIGAATKGSTHLIGTNLAMFGLGLLGYTVYLYTLRGFYALRDTRTPFFLNVAENTINVVLALILEPSLGVPGLALSYAIAYTAAAVFALWALRRRVGRLDAKRTMRTMVRIGIACLAMAGAVAAAIRIVGGPYIVQTGVGVIVGVAVFVTAILLLRVDEVATLRARLIRR